MKESNFLDECKKIVFKNVELFQALEEYDKTHKLPKFTHKERIDITIDSEILRKFKVLCEKKGYKLSNRIEKLIIKDLSS